MQNHFISKLTRTYILALGLIAILTLGTSVTLHQVILTQADSALLVNVSGGQRWLSQKVTLLGIELIHSSEISERNRLREELTDTIAQLVNNHRELVEGSPDLLSPRRLSPQMQSMYFNPPINMQIRINRFATEAQALAQDPENLHTPDNPHLIYLLQNRESLLKSLDQIVSLYQKESEAKVQKLRMLEIVSGVAILLTLIFLGLYIFRPLANTLLKERSQLEAANQELGFLSSIDGLTGIANRRHFDQFLEQLWILSARNGDQIAVIMCDIDYFKAYNDTYGHLQGDECLKEVATSLKNTIKRQGDLVARYGGEEFVVVLSSTDQAGALNIAEALRANVESLDIPHRLSLVIPKVTISLGVAIGQAKPGNLPKSVIEAADAALYQAKQDGRNCYKLATI